MDWNESVSLYCSSPWILDGMYQSYFIHSFIDLTSKRKKGEKESVTDAIDRQIVRCGMLSKPILRNGLYYMYTFDIIAKRNITNY